MELQIHNLVKTYNKNTVVDIPSLTINSREIVGIVGNNGAGKTTFLRLVLDLIKADEGYILSNNKKVCEDEKWKEYTGSFIDGRFLIDFYTPEEYFSFIGSVYALSPEIINERLNLFNSFMSNEILNKKKYIRNYSEGNRQKIGIIGAMLINPKVLVLDEPFNYLDPTSQITMAKLLQHLNKIYGTTIIISSHNLSFIVDISSRILLLEKGCIIKDINTHHCNAQNAQNAQNELNEYFNEERNSSLPIYNER